MAKRIVTKIGNVFCAEIDNEFKCYFQYISNDLYNLNSSVIRVFKKRYPMDSNPTIDQIINDEVAFYAHTILRFGIQFNAWYKIGKSTEIGEKELKKVYFCQTQDHEAVFNPFPELIWVDPLKNWYLWHVNEEHQRIGKLPKKYWTIVEPGGVIPYIDIINRMRYGFYKYASVMYDVIKRIPLPDVDVYLKTEEDGIVTYYQFKGSHAVRQLIVTDGKEIRLTADNPKADGRKLRTADFGDTNWRNQDFIEKDEFDRAWNENRCQ